MVAISALAYILQDILHEGLGHGVTALPSHPSAPKRFGNAVDFRQWHCREPRFRGAFLTDSAPRAPLDASHALFPGAVRCALLGTQMQRQLALRVPWSDQSINFGITTERGEMPCAISRDWLFVPSASAPAIAAAADPPVAPLQSSLQVLPGPLPAGRAASAGTSFPTPIPSRVIPALP